MQASEHWDVLMSWKQALPLAYWNLRAIRLSRPLDLPASLWLHNSQMHSPF